MFKVQIDHFAVAALQQLYLSKLLAYRAEILPEYTFGLVDYKYLTNWNLRCTIVCILPILHNIGLLFIPHLTFALDQQSNMYKNCYLNLGTYSSAVMFAGIWQTSQLSNCLRALVKFRSFVYSLTSDEAPDVI